MHELAAIDVKTAATAFAIFVGAIGGSASIATLVSRGFFRRRQRQRRDDAFWGYETERGHVDGEVDRFRAHMADRSIHNYPGPNDAR